jgi:hypothetical protein
LQTLTDYINAASENYVGKEIAITADLEGLRLLDEPLAGFAEASDPYFETLKQDGVIGDHFILPEEWLPAARTVISIFFPFTETVKSANSRDPAWPAAEWLHSRIEGQALVFAACRYMKEFLEAQGESCVVPSLDTRFSLKSPFSSDPAQQKYYTSTAAASARSPSPAKAGFPCGADKQPATTTTLSDVRYVNKPMKTGA